MSANFSVSFKRWSNANKLFRKSHAHIVQIDWFQLSSAFKRFASVIGFIYKSILMDINVRMLLGCCCHFTKKKKHIHVILIENCRMESKNSVCPLKWFNTRLIGFWSFTNRFSESKFSVGSVHTANSFTHHHSLIARPNNDPKLRFWVTLEGERGRGGGEGVGDRGNVLYNTVQCTLPGSKMAKYIGKSDARTTSTMYKWIGIHCAVFICVQVTVEFDFSTFCGKLSHAKCDGNHKATTSISNTHNEIRKWQTTSENWCILHIYRFNLSNGINPTKKYTSKNSTNTQRQNKIKNLMLSMMIRCLLYNLCYGWK